MTNPTVAIDIVGNNLVDRGAGQAEKRLDKLGSHAAGVGKKMGKKGGFGNVARTFSEVDEAASAVFGNSSVFGTIGKRFGAVAKLGGALNTGLGRASSSLGRVGTVGETAASTLGTTAVEGAAAAGGMEEAAAAAGGLAVAMGPVAVVGAAVVATLGAAAVAGYKVASGWAASTAQMGRFAETIGIAAKNLQELQGAGERYGIGKDATNSSVASFAQNVHDAYYARNPAVRVLLKKLGVGFSKGADGNLDYDKMLRDTSRGLAAQSDPQAALQAANTLGVAGMLPLLRKGPANLQAETSSVDKYGVVNSDADIDTAKTFTRSATMMSQMADRAKQASQAWTARKYGPAMDAGVYLGQHATEGTLGASVARAVGSIAPAATKMDRAGDKMLAAANTIGGAVEGGSSFADAIRDRGERSRDWQVSPKGARSSMQVMPATARRPGFGIRPAANDSIAEYNRVGRDYANALLAHYGGDWALASAAFNAGTKPVDRWIRRNGDPRRGEISDDDWIAKIPGHGKGSFAETRAYADRVTHVHEFRGLPKGTAVKSRTIGSPAVSMSFATD